jgi:hypothetical protein
MKILAALLLIQAFSCGCAAEVNKADYEETPFERQLHRRRHSDRRSLTTICSEIATSSECPASFNDECPGRDICRKAAGSPAIYCDLIETVDCGVTDEECETALTDCGCDVGSTIDCSTVGGGCGNKLSSICTKMSDTSTDPCPLTNSECPLKAICKTTTATRGSQAEFCLAIAALNTCTTEADQCETVLVNCGCGDEDVVDCSTVSTKSHSRRGYHRRNHFH